MNDSAFSLRSSLQDLLLLQGADDVGFSAPPDAGEFFPRLPYAVSVVIRLSDAVYGSNSIASVGVAAHEAGHAVVMHMLPGQDPVSQITIVPRGMAGGMTISLPEEDRSYLSKHYMEDQIVGLLGGRVAEKLCLNDISTGASNDIQRATAIARKMVTVYGMSERLGTVSFDSGNDEVFIGRTMGHSRGYSEAVAAQIDQEVKDLVDGAYRRCQDILEAQRDKLEQVAQYLLEHETMDAETFEKVFTDQWDGAPAPTQAQTAPDLPAPPAKEEHYDDRD